MASYFVFCEYYKSFNPKALLIPLDEFDQEMLDKLQQITQLGDKIERNWKESENMYYSAGYRINNQIDNTPETDEIISYWSSLLRRVDSDYSGAYSNNYYLYYMNDHNAGLSASELYDSLSNIKIYDEKDINVEKCVMVSDVRFDLVKRSTLRFFCAKQNCSIEEIEKIIMKDDRFCSIICATKENGMYAGYGYVKLNNNNDYRLLLNRSISIDGIDFLFDN